MSGGYRIRAAVTSCMKGAATVFEYFPGNYVWNLAVVAALNSGGLIEEVDRACPPIREAAARGEDAVPGTSSQPGRTSPTSSKSGLGPR